MKRVLVFLLSLYTFTAYSLTSKEFEQQLIKLKKTFTSKAPSHLEHKDNVILKAYKKLRKPNEYRDVVAFEKNESKALSFINSFDTNKLVFFDDYAMDSLLFNHCSKENIQTYNDVLKDKKFTSTEMKESQFIQGLVSAVHLYNWSDQTKKIAKQKVFEYMNYKTSKQGPLINQLTVRTILNQMLIHNLVDKKLVSEITELNKASNEKRKKWLSENRELTTLWLKDPNNCDLYLKLKKPEYDLSESLRKKYFEVLKKLN